MSKQFKAELIKVYINMRSAFTGVFLEDITEDDTLKLYILNESLKHYFNIDGDETVDE